MRWWLPSVIRPTPTLSALGAAWRWLADNGEPEKRLAGLLETTPGNLYTIISRERASSRRHLSVNTKALLAPTPEQFWSTIKLRDEQEQELAANQASIRQLRAELDAIVTSHTGQAEYLRGARALRKLRSRVGFPASASLRRLRAHIDMGIAWFLVHSGFTASAVEEASHALWVFEHLYRELQDREDLLGISDSLTLLAHGFSLQRQPAPAFEVLSYLQRFLHEVNIQPSPEVHRLRGVAFFQMSRNEDACRSFLDAERAMSGEPKDHPQAEIRHTGSRHSNLIQIEWDSARQLLEDVRLTFGERSLHFSVNTHWTAACGLMVGTRDADNSALELLESNRELANRFGHQSTLTFLLSITPELKLSPGLRRLWIRRSLYENALRSE